MILNDFLLNFGSRTPTYCIINEVIIIFYCITSRSPLTTDVSLLYLSSRKQSRAAGLQRMTNISYISIGCAFGGDITCALRVSPVKSRSPLTFHYFL